MPRVLSVTATTLGERGNAVVRAKGKGKGELQPRVYMQAEIDMPNVVGDPTIELSPAEAIVTMAGATHTCWVKANLAGATHTPWAQQGVTMTAHVEEHDELDEPAQSA